MRCTLQIRRKDFCNHFPHLMHFHISQAIRICFFSILLCGFNTASGQQCNFVFNKDSEKKLVSLEGIIKEEPLELGFDFNDQFTLITINGRELYLVDNQNFEWSDLTNTFSNLQHEYKGVKYFDKIQKKHTYLSPSRSIITDSDTLDWVDKPVMPQEPYSLYNFKLDSFGFTGIYGATSQFVQDTNYLLKRSNVFMITQSKMLAKYNINEAELKLAPIAAWVDHSSDYLSKYVIIESVLNFYELPDGNLIIPTGFRENDLKNSWYSLGEVSNHEGVLKLKNLYSNARWEGGARTINYIYDNFKLVIKGDLYYFYTGYDISVYNTKLDTTQILPLNFDDRNRVVDFLVNDNSMFVIFEIISEREYHDSQSLRYNFAYEFAVYNLSTFEKVDSCFIQQEGDKKWLKFDESGRLIKQVSIEENKILIHDMHIAN